VHQLHSTAAAAVTTALAGGDLQGCRFPCNIAGTSHGNEMCDFPFAELEPKTLRSKKLLGRDKNEAPQVGRNKQHPCIQGYLCQRSSIAPI